MFFNFFHFFLKRFQLLETFPTFVPGNTYIINMKPTYEAPQTEVLELQLGINILSNDSPNGGYDQNDLGDI